MPKKQILIVGAGITGLSLAYYLQKEASEKNFDWQIRILDSASQSGGILQSQRLGEALFEKGPDSFLNENPLVRELCVELGISGEIISTRPENRRSFILRNGKLISVPEGFYLIGPSRVWPFLNSPIFTLSGKLRMMCEYFIPAKKSKIDESVASFVRRRFGQEALERMAQPMLAGIYTGDPETLSLGMTMPKFLDMEAKHGSVIRALRAAKTSASGPRYGLFLSFKNGMQTLTDALASRVPKGAIHLNTSVNNLYFDASDKMWNVQCTNENFKADMVYLCTSASSQARILQNILPDLSSAFSDIGYESVATLNLLYNKSAIHHPLNGFGFVVPATENNCLVGCSFSSQKYQNRSGESEVLLRAFIGGAFGNQFYVMDDEQLIQKAQEELSKILDIHEKPKSVLLTRWPKSMIQYKTRYKDFLSNIDTAISGFPGLVVAGPVRGGVGISDRVAQSRQLASQTSEYLK